MEVKPHSATLGRTIVFLVMTGIFASSALAGTSIVKSKHDFSMTSTGTNFGQGQFQTGPGNEWGPIIEEVCVFCHTPHGASTDPQTNTLLWNRISSPPAGYSYKIYTSLTITGPDGMNNGKPTGVSMMCMSCHDGVTSIAVNVNNDPLTPTLLNAPGAGNPQVSLDQMSSLLPGLGTINQAYNGGPLGWGANIGDTLLSGSTFIDLSNDHPISFNYPPTRSDLQEPTGASGLRLFGAGKRVECATCHLVHNPSIEPFLAMSNSESLMCRECHKK